MPQVRNELPWPPGQPGQSRPYVIAEAGVNHNGRIEMASQLIDAARRAGADCVKFQAYSTSELVTRSSAKADYQQACGPAGESQFEMLQRYELPVEAFGRLKAYCDKQGLDFLVTPFSPRWVNLLEELHVSAYKIGSGNLCHPDLLEAVGRTGKCVFVSKGMASLAQSDRALQALRRAGCSWICLLHCISSYPTPIEDAHLRTIGMLAAHTGLPIGFSDHTRQIETGLLAVNATAVVLEKHLTLDNTLAGPDHAMSLTPDQLAEYIRLARHLGTIPPEKRQRYIDQDEHLAAMWAVAAGDALTEPLPAERRLKTVAGLSVVAAYPIGRGTMIAPAMLTIKRPGSGIPPDQRHLIIGRIAARDIGEDQPIEWDDIDKDTGPAAAPGSAGSPRISKVENL
ncbi:MAG: N-acetylneuraminate synthase family protein [Sedimentisphaerales bacterium]|nr:N-acetylneuraminate synthase family protein [Sedimentisphaerales bacterium]